MPLWVGRPELGTQKPQSHLQQVPCPHQTRHAGLAAHTDPTVRRERLAPQGRGTRGSRAEGAQFEERPSSASQAWKGDLGLSRHSRPEGHRQQMGPDSAAGPQRGGGRAPSAGRRVAGGGRSPPGLRCPTAPGSQVYCPPSHWLNSCQTCGKREGLGQPGLAAQASVVLLRVTWPAQSHTVLCSWLFSHLMRTVKASQTQVNREENVDHLSASTCP